MPPVLFKDAMSYTEADQLNDGLLVQLKGVQPNLMKLSRSLNDFEEHVLCGLRQRFRHLENQGIAKKPNDEILREFGFNTGSSVSLAILQQCSRADNHLELIDWVVIYVQDVIRYKLFVRLTYNFTRFPFQETAVNTWFRIGPEGSENPVERAINVINIDAKDRQQNLYSPQYGDKFPDNLLDDEHVLFFHGTDHKSAVGIISDGIELTKGKIERDFSNGRGFYLNNNFTETEDLGFYKSSRPAVLVYRINIQVLDEHRDGSVNLCGQEKKNEWKRIVTQCRSGRSPFSKREMKRITFIEGPMASVRQRFNPAHFRAKEGSYQLCILSENMAEQFDNFLHSVIFYNNI